ncbi:MAG: pilin N-terminal domain-containing protein [Bilifractor sp.]|jgi:hypothetical protein
MKKFLICVTVMISLLCPCIVSAADKNVPNPPYTLTIDFSRVADNGDRVPIEGGKFAVYKAADLVRNGGAGSYSVVSPYTSLASYDENGNDITFHELAFSDMVFVAKQFAAIDNTPIDEKVTGSDGYCTFTITEPGKYLVVETGDSGKAESYKTVDPYLVNVPLSMKDTAGNLVWEKAVLSAPKTGKEEPYRPTPSVTETVTATVTATVTSTVTPTPQKNTITPDGGTEQSSSSFLNRVKTGDDSHVVLYLVLGVSSLILGVYFLSREAENRHKRS